MKNMLSNNQVHAHCRKSTLLHKQTWNHGQRPSPSAIFSSFRDTVRKVNWKLMCFHFVQTEYKYSLRIQDDILKFTYYFIVYFFLYSRNPSTKFNNTAPRLQYSFSILQAKVLSKRQKNLIKMETWKQLWTWLS